MSVPLLPLKIEFKEWASQLRSALPHLNLPIPGEDDEWRDWATQISLSNISIDIPLATNLAYPKTEDWRRWGAYFINTVFI